MAFKNNQQRRGSNQRSSLTSDQYGAASGIKGERRGSTGKASSLGKHLAKGSPMNSVGSPAGSQAGRRQSGGNTVRDYEEESNARTPRGFAPPPRSKSATQLRGQQYSESEAMSPPASARNRSESPGSTRYGMNDRSPRSEASTRTGGGPNDTGSMASSPRPGRPGGWAVASSRAVAQRASAWGRKEFITTKFIDAHPILESPGGKWVRHDLESDSRGGTCMRGGVQVKDNLCDQETEYEELQRKIRSDMKKAGQSVQFCGFTDRTIRNKDGTAVKTLFESPDANPSNERHKKGCSCPKCKPMASSLLPPAGQVIMVDVGGAGDPPYKMQTEVSGLMPASVGTDVYTNPTMGIPKTAPLQSSDFSGRHWLMKQMLPEYKKAAQERAIENGSKDLVPRGCEPPPPQLDFLRIGEGVKAAMVAEAADPATEGTQLMRKELGNKRCMDSVPGSRTKEQEPFTYDIHETIKRPPQRSSASLGGLLCGSWKDKNGESTEKPYRRMKNAGEFPRPPGITTSACSPMTCQVADIASSPCGNLHNVTNDMYREAVHVDMSSAGITKWELSVPGRHHKRHGEDSTTMRTCLAHMQRDDVLRMREHRLHQDHKFKHACENIQRSVSTNARVVNDIRSKSHHLASPAVANALQWVC